MVTDGRRNAWDAGVAAGRGLLIAASVLALTTPGTAGAGQARAPQANLPAGGGGGGDYEPPGGDCLADTTGQVSATPNPVPLGQTSTVRWSMTVPSGCPVPTLKLNGLTVSRSGNMVVNPTGPTAYALRASIGGASRTLAQTTLQVTLPRDAHGRVALTITANNQVWPFLAAIQEAWATINIQNHVELDLSGYAGLNIAPGVRIIGTRSPRLLGPRLFTRSKPDTLFRLFGGWGDGVRITGVRIDGGVMGVAEVDDPVQTAILIESRVNVEVDNCEIYGWPSSGIKVTDEEGRIDRTINPFTIRIHGNYIHHNQRKREQGYGITVKEGAYALIEKNVFDWNRHAIEGDGSDGVGYYALRNLVLQHGGLNAWIPIGGWWTNTHMFDMHGQEDCWGYDAYCGRAGEYMELRDNSFFYTDGDAFKLRGTPSISARVLTNAFAHDQLLDDLTGSGALDQTETGLFVQGNLIDQNEWGNFGQCDFEGDGLPDLFLATGRAWWYNSGGDRHWIYLNTSNKRLADVFLGDVDGDNRCDVVAAGVVSSGGRGASDRLQTSLAWRDNGNGNQVVWRMNGGTVEFSPYPHYMQDLQFRGAGDFTGDGHEDVLLQRPAGEVIIWELVRGTYIRMRSSGPAPMGATFQAVGDFNGDRIADVLWRDATGKPEIWFEGRPGSDTDAIPLPPAFPVYWNGATPSFEWQTVGTGDFDGDGRSDIIWRHLNGQVAIWFMSGGILIGDTYPGLPSTQPIFQRVADFDGNGRSDILWRYASGKLVLWPDGDASRAASPAYQNNEWHVTDPAWQVQAASDFNFDGRADILWRHSNGQLAIWFMAGRTFLGDTLAGTVPATMTLNGVLRGAQ